MKKIVLLILLLCSGFVFSQNEQLAQNYFDKGDFEKAKISFEELLRSQPYNSYYFQRIIECNQQLQLFDLVEKSIVERYKQYKQSNLLVELGCNYLLKKDEVNAKKYFDEALDKIRKNPVEVYNVASTLERKSQVELAIKAYDLALDVGKGMNFNFNFALANLYGQLGRTDMMIEKYLLEAYTNPQNNVLIQNQLTRFMNEDADVTFNEALKKALIVRTQQSQDVFWNEYLSWFYVQQKEFGKAFIQQKAIYKRNPETFFNILNLADIAVQDGDRETAIAIYSFVLDNTKDLELLIKAHTYLIEIRIDAATEKEYPAVATEIENLLKEFGISPYSLSLQIVQADFTAFKLRNPELGKDILRKALNLPLNKYEQASLKMKLGDILLFEEKFNQALIYYSQIEEDLKNDVVGHEASLKVAKTSYFKADFTWAQKQFKELKSASTQLIANDALEYFLLINDNTVADSTQTALKELAHADYLVYQNKTQAAILKYQAILKSFKGQEIEAVTLYHLGKIYEKSGDFNTALIQYQTIIDQHKECVYVDEAYYFAAEIYSKSLNDNEKAKSYYEHLIFNHEDSIYFTDARKKFRQLRGDTTL